MFKKQNNWRQLKCFHFLKTDFLVNFRQIIVSNEMYLPVITTFCFCYVRIFLLAFNCCHFLPTAKNFYFFHEICLLDFAVLLQKEIFNHGISVSLTVSLFTFQHFTIQWIGFFSIVPHSPFHKPNLQCCQKANVWNLT